MPFTTLDHDLVSRHVGTGGTLNYNYASGTDDSISRLSSISDTSGTLESYQYLGLSTVVVRAHPLSKVDLTYVKQTGDAANADKYSGLDRFNRVIDQRWVKTGTNPGTADRLQYTYDANDNVLSKTNTLDATKTETYTYDNLNQLTGYSRGGSTLQTFAMDGMGNFQTIGTGAAATSQTRTTNSQNEINSITTGTTTVALAYDANGNLTKDETGALLTYDAWNRLVKMVKGNTTVNYKYDTLGRRITETTGTTTKDLYYSKDWQVIEERESGVAKTQYVWSPVYVDAMIERDSDVNGGSDGLEQRLWPLQDANFNTTALVDNNGTAIERYVYDIYGKVTVFAANGTTIRTSSSVDWIYLHQGGRLDTTTGLYNFRNRDYSPTLMRWTTNDPIGFGGGDTNTYRYVGNGPTGAVDPSGLAVQNVDNTEGTPSKDAIYNAQLNAAYAQARYYASQGRSFNLGQHVYAIEVDKFWGKRDWVAGKPKEPDELELQAKDGAFGTNSYGGGEGLKAAAALGVAAYTVRVTLPRYLAAKGVEFAADRVGGKLVDKFAAVLFNATAGVFRIVKGKLYKIVNRGGQEVAETVSAKEAACIKDRFDSFVESSNIAPFPVKGRMPINHGYAGKRYFSALPSDLQKKYPKGVAFDSNGFPVFTPYSIKSVNIQYTGSRVDDFIAANKAADLKNTPKGYTWHHHQDVSGHGQGRMELIPSDLHGEVKHTGGVARWEELFPGLGSYRD